MTGVKFTIDVIDKTDAKLKSLEKQSEKTTKAIDGIASSLNKAFISQKTLVEREAIAKKLSATKEKLTFTKEKLFNVKEKGDLDDLSFLKYKADIKKLSADRAKYRLETIKFKEKLNQEITQNIKKQEREIVSKVTPINYVKNSVGRNVGIIPAGKSMLVSEFDLTSIGGASQRFSGLKASRFKSGSLGREFVYKSIAESQGRGFGSWSSNLTKKAIESDKIALEATIKANEEEIKNQKEREKERKKAEKQEIKNQKEREKEREKADKQEIKNQKERAKYSQKLTEFYQKAKASPISYVTDRFGRIAGVVKSGSTERADVLNSMGLGGNKISSAEAKEFSRRYGGGGGSFGDGGFLGGRRTFAQIGAGYLGYKTAVLASNMASSAFRTPIEMENLRASMGAMVFGSGTTDRTQMNAKVEDQIKFLRKMGDKYGINYMDVAPEYMRIMANRVGGKSKFSEQHIQDITEGFAGLSRVSGLNSEKTKLVFLAVSQMMSRGKIQGQELNQQLREQMALGPVVIEKAIEKTVNDPTLQKKNPELYRLYSQYKNKKINLDELMEKGVIGSGNLIHVLNVMQEMLKGMEIEKSHTFTGELTRVVNELNTFNDIMTKKAMPSVTNLLVSFKDSLKYVNEAIGGSIKEGGIDGSIYDVLASNKTSGQKATSMLLEGGLSIGKALMGAWGTKLLLQYGSKATSILGTGVIGAGTASIAGGAVGASMLGYEAYSALANALASADQQLWDDEKAQYNNLFNKKQSLNIFSNNSDIPTAGDLMRNFREQMVRKPQQVELVLRIEGNSDGIFPNIFTSSGVKLNPGKNIIAGGNQSYAP